MTPPVLEFPTPLVTAGTEISTLKAGSGVQAVEGSTVDFHVAAYLGSGGQLLTASSYVPDQPVRRVIDDEGDDYFSKVLRCATTGERLIITDQVAAVFGPIPEDEIVQNDSTVVLVVDVLQAYPAQADGSPQGLVDQAPMIVQHPSGRHGVTIPMGSAPDELVVYTVKKGTGPALEEGDKVVAHFTGVVWQTQQTFSSSFDQGTPVTLTLLDGSAADATAGVIGGVFTGLMGQTVGSQVAIVVPPDQGYPAGEQPAGVPDGSTLVYVFDILGIQ
jgi:peptidylprolyl isomerase